MKDKNIAHLKGIWMIAVVILLIAFFITENYILFFTTIIYLYIIYIAIPFIKSIFLPNQERINWKVELKPIDIEKLPEPAKEVIANFQKLEWLVNSKEKGERTQYLIPVCIIIRDYTMEYVTSNRQQKNKIIEYVPELAQIYEQPYDCMKSLLYALKLICEIYNENDFYNGKQILKECNSKLEKNIQKLQRG